MSPLVILIRMLRHTTVLCLFLISTLAIAQAPYVAPTDTAVASKLERWKDLKFGLLMHWGPYSQWGVVESWSICPEDEDWCKRRPEHGATYNEYVKNYEALQTTFNPVKFDPDKWAKAAKDAGMKYVVFTTKHHDGFCMFDTKTTDYRITSPQTPFHNSPRANVTKEIFTAFRTQGLWTGAYFSKPDWHSPDYWWPYFPPKDRSVNYLPTKHPERWQAFKDHTYAQIEELMTGYGPVDILWLDGGWVRPLSTIDTSVSWQKAITIEQDIDMPRIATMARKHQPGLLVVDRTVGGEYENYVTPEGHVPDADLGVPWETCMPMGTSWSWVPNEQYKTTDEIIRTLVSVVTRGGSLLLNVAPGPDGQLDSTAYVRLKEVGEWLKVNGEAVYGTRASKYNAPAASLGASESSKTTKGGKEQHFMYIFLDGSATEIRMDMHALRGKTEVKLLGSTSPLKVQKTVDTGVVQIPADPGSARVRVLRISARLPIGMKKL
ncbi:MAG: alpha-L-fucosidase [Flavobacteriales bacterium]|nr:alpha-L-fucosidase [Flavobacteriales bacterium]